MNLHEALEKHELNGHSWFVSAETYVFAASGDQGSPCPACAAPAVNIHPVVRRHTLFVFIPISKRRVHGFICSACNARFVEESRAAQWANIAVGLFFVLCIAAFTVPLAVVLWLFLEEMDPASILLALGVTALVAGINFFPLRSLYRRLQTLRANGLTRMDKTLLTAA